MYKYITRWDIYKGAKMKQFIKDKSIKKWIIAKLKEDDWVEIKHGLFHTDKYSIQSVEGTLYLRLGFKGPWFCPVKELSNHGGLTFRPLKSLND
jgi:hypothetical protein